MMASVLKLKHVAYQLCNYHTKLSCNCGLPPFLSTSSPQRDAHPKNVNILMSGLMLALRESGNIKSPCLLINSSVD